MELPHILIVQTDTPKRNALMSILRRNKMKCTGVAEAILALKQIEHEHYDLIIIIDHFEDMPGQELVGLIKNHSLKNKVIFVSSTPDAEEQKMAEAMLVDQYMPDYSDKNILLKSIKRLL